MLKSAHAPPQSEPPADSREQGEAPPQGVPLRQGVHSSAVQGLRQQAGSRDQQHHIVGANELLHIAPVGIDQGKPVFGTFKGERDEAKVMGNPSKNPYSKSDSISYMVCDLPPGGRDQNIFSVEYEIFFACDR